MMIIELPSELCSGSIYSLTNLRFSSAQTLQFALIKFPVPSSDTYSPVHFAELTLIFPQNVQFNLLALKLKANLGLIFVQRCESVSQKLDSETINGFVFYLGDRYEIAQHLSVFQQRLHTICVCQQKGLLVFS